MGKTRARKPRKGPTRKRGAGTRMPRPFPLKLDTRGAWAPSGVVLYDRLDFVVRSWDAILFRHSHHR